jgi:hypothetical protein
MIKEAVVILAIGILCTAGCASIKPVPITGPNGNQGYSMRCSGMGRSLEQCYRTAGTLCNAGYEVVSENTSTVAIPSGESFIASPQTTLTIECR